MLDKVKEYIKSLEKKAIPQLSINCVIFGFSDKSLQVIINKITLNNTTISVLPGGYVKQSEDLTYAVKRIVKESTGLEKILFKQFAVFGLAFNMRWVAILLPHSIIQKRNPRRIGFQRSF